MTSIIKLTFSLNEIKSFRLNDAHQQLPWEKNHYIFLLWEFFRPALANGFFHWSLSDSKSPQVSRTRPTILANLNNGVVWMVSTCPLIFKFPRPLTGPLGTVPNPQLQMVSPLPSCSIYFLSCSKVLIFVSLFAFF